MMEEIPFSLVSYATWLQLANKLDIRCTVSGNDWRLLAEYLGYGTEEILVLEEKRSGDGRNTLKLFQDYIKREGSTVNKVLQSLDKMKRTDALDILKNEMPEIEERFRKQKLEQRKRPPQTPVENECSWRHHHHHPPHFPVVNPAYYSHSIPSMCVGCNSVSHNGAPRDNYGSYVSPPFHPVPSQSTYCGPALSPVSSCACCSMSNTFPSHKCMKESHFSGSLNQRTNPSITTPQRHTGECSPRSRMSETPGRRLRAHKNVMSSLQANTDGEHLDDEFDMESDNDVEMFDSSNSMEQPASLPRVILRGQSSTSYSVSSIPSIRSSGDIDIAREEEVATSNDLEQPMRQVPNFSRQISEECNSKQPIYNISARQEDGCLGASGRVVGSKKRLNIPDALAEDTGQEQEQQGAAGPLESLVNLVNQPRKYMPNEEYTTVVAEQKVDDVQMAKPQTVLKKEKEDDYSCHFRGGFLAGAGLSQGRGLQRGKNGLTDNPKTFPLRVKTHTAGVTMEELHRQAGTQQLTKSRSMPIDMKMAEFRKAFRNIKVFVTYSIDNKKHLQRILSLCNCLEKNGFNCSVDIYGQKGSHLSLAERITWFEKKFQEADFILVCISPKFKMDIDSPEPAEEDSVGKNKLHTKYIYDMMYQEFTHSNHNKRFIPLMFEGASEEHVPAWLHNTLIYHWPRQYKDLLWMLTKPEERIKPMAKSFGHPNSARSSPSPQEQRHSPFPSPSRQ